MMNTLFQFFPCPFNTSLTVLINWNSSLCLSYIKFGKSELGDYNSHITRSCCDGLAKAINKASADMTLTNFRQKHNSTGWKELTWTLLHEHEKLQLNLSNIVIIRFIKCKLRFVWVAKIIRKVMRICNSFWNNSKHANHRLVKVKISHYLNYNLYAS